MNKKESFERMTAYNEYAKNCNPRHIPTKGESTGTFGRDYESRVKFLLGNYRNKTFISDKKGIDTIKKLNGKMVKFEIKNRCSTIGNYRNGKTEFPFLNSDFVIYTMDYKPIFSDSEILENSFVIPSKDFYNILSELNLIRNNTARLEFQIQVFYTSKKRTNAFYNALSEFPTLSELFEI